MRLKDSEMGMHGFLQEPSTRARVGSIEPVAKRGTSQSDRSAAYMSSFGNHSGIKCLGTNNSLLSDGFVP